METFKNIVIGTINIKEDITTKIIVNQLIRSLTSIGANIIEAKASNSKEKRCLKVFNLWFWFLIFGFWFKYL